MKYYIAIFKNGFAWLTYSEVSQGLNKHNKSLLTEQLRLRPLFWWNMSLSFSRSIKYILLFFVAMLEYRLAKKVFKTFAEQQMLYRDLISFMVCVSLFLLLVLEPPVLLNNLTDCIVNESSSVILSCPSEGVPPPTITWYKDEHTLSQGSGTNDTMNMQSAAALLALIFYLAIFRYCNINRGWDPPYWPNHWRWPGSVYLPGHQWEGFCRELCLYMGQW